MCCMQYREKNNSKTILRGLDLALHSILKDLKKHVVKLKISKSRKKWEKSEKSSSYW